MDNRVDEAVSAALALAELEQRGAAGRIDEAMRDRILMAQEINRLRELNNALVSAIRLSLPALDLLRSKYPRWKGDDSFDVLAFVKAVLSKAEGR